jgi:hypothetical protein
MVQRYLAQLALDPRSVDGHGRLAGCHHAHYRVAGRGAQIDASDLGEDRLVPGRVGETSSVIPRFRPRAPLGHM